MKRNFLVLVALSLSACAAPSSWVKDDMTAFNQDSAECEYDATKAVPDNGYGNVFSIALERGNIYNQCMKVRGYTKE